MIRQATLADAEAITKIYNHYIECSDATFETEQLTVDDMTQRMKRLASHPFYVWDDGSSVVAYCYAHPWKERAAYANTFETTVYVAPDSWRKGIGRALMMRLIDECGSRGIHALIACITAGNDGSIALHRQLGFEEVSFFKEVGNKFNRWLGIIDMELLL